MTVLFAWTNRASEKISYESLKLATELPDNELRRTLWVYMCKFVIEKQMLNLNFISNW